MKVRAHYRNATLRVVGAGTQREELIQLRDQLGLAAYVAFVGSLDLEALASEYARATCFVLPSRSEPWGLVVNEALSYGCPVVVSDNCGCSPELVHEGVTGFVFETDNIGDLEEKLLAASNGFIDASISAQHCLDLISAYTPERAAHETLRGCVKILSWPKQ